MHHNLRLFPVPILTRWGTWLKAATYCGKHFDEVKGVINTFD